MNEYKRMKQQVEESIAKRCDELAEEVIDKIIEGGLIKATCAEDKEHECVVMWSSGAQEQIAAIIANGRPSSC
jgi:hypothetical protein